MISFDRDTFCDLDFKMGEFGVYEIIADGTVGSGNCESKTNLEPVNIYLRE